MAKKEVPAVYKAWVTAEARKISSDGCTKVSEWNQWCCFEHDLGCTYERDPREAFKLAVAGEPNYWSKAPFLSRREVDVRFAQCNFNESEGVKDYARTGIRYIGVRIGSIVKKLWPF